MERILTLHPDPGKAGVRILRWNCDVVREAILNVVPFREPGLPFNDLARAVKNTLSEDTLADLGSVGWYTTTVKLDLEAPGEIERMKGVRPQRWVRAG
jgi:hypothetical protein